MISHKIQEPIEQMLKTQKAKLHSKGGKESPEGGSWLAWFLEKIVLVMVAYFVLSIVNSLAQNYNHRLQTKKHNVTAVSPRQKIQRSKAQTAAKQA